MFKIDYSRDFSYKETNRCVHLIDGVEKFIDFQNQIYGIVDGDDICFGDDQIDAINYYPNKSEMSVRVVHANDTSLFFVVFDFFGVEIEYIDIAPEHWIDEMLIQQNDDELFSISFGSGGLDFRYKAAKINRFWEEKRL